MIRDTVSKEYTALLKGVAPVTIGVGIHSDEGAAKHSDSEQTILEIGAIHEFGSGHIPHRSFLRAWYDANEAKFSEVAGKEFLDALSDGDQDRHAERVALWAQGQIQQRMGNGIPPPNAESTILAKGSAKPLIDKGILRASILGKVLK